MIVRRASVDISYNGVSVTEPLAGYQLSVKYSDPASGQADSLDISIHDRERKWINEWLPSDGDTLTAAITATDAERTNYLPCGTFGLDKAEFSGWPVSGTLSGVSVPVDSSFRSTERTKLWESVTLQEIGKEIATRAGISLVWDVADAPFVLQSVEQSQKTDCDFYMSLCETYGLAMKVYSGKIVVYDREAYKAKKSASSLAARDLLSWSWSRESQGAYTGGEYTYTDPLTEEEIKVTVGSGSRILKQSGKADDWADAERKIRAAVNNANHGTTKLSCSILGTAALVASQCVDVSGIGRLSGKYYIDNISHSISGSGGYTMELELSLVDGTALV